MTEQRLTTRCVWCGKQRKAFSEWEQQDIASGEWKPVCNPCATRNTKKGTAMTEQQRLTIRAELARRMGWTDLESCKDWDFTFSPSGLPPGQKEYKNIPDPFASAEDKDALVEWLAADDARWHAFWLQLKAWMESRGNFPAYNPSGLVARWLLTLPREVVTLAAARALGIQEAGE